MKVDYFLKTGRRRSQKIDQVKDMKI
jgi:hypothetical protein